MVSGLHVAGGGGPEITDPFTYSNGRLETVSSGVWLDSGSAMAVSSNAIAMSSANTTAHARHTTALSSADYYAELTVTPGNTEYAGIGLMVRMNTNLASINGYRVEMAFYSLNHHIGIERYDAGVNTFIDDVNLGASDSSPHLLRVEIVGTDLDVYVDDVLEISVVASSHTSNTGVGLYAARFGGAVAAADNFEAGTF